MNRPFVAIIFHMAAAVGVTIVERLWWARTVLA